MAFYKLDKNEINVIKKHGTGYREDSILDNKGLVVRSKGPKKSEILTIYKKGVNPFDNSIKSELMFNQMAHKFKNVAKKLNIDITWGGDWKNFKDLPHFELKN